MEEVWAPKVSRVTLGLGYNLHIFSMHEGAESITEDLARFLIRRFF